MNRRDIVSKGPIALIAALFGFNTEAKAAIKIVPVPVQMNGKFRVNGEKGILTKLVPLAQVKDACQYLLVAYWFGADGLITASHQQMIELTAMEMVNKNIDLQTWEEEQFYAFVKEMES